MKKSSIISILKRKYSLDEINRDVTKPTSVFYDDSILNSSRASRCSTKRTSSPNSSIPTPNGIQKMRLERIHSYKTFRILVLGPSNVGKSCLLERFTRNTFCEDYLPTVSDTYETGIFLDIDNKLKQFDIEFFDFGGNIKKDFVEAYKGQISKADGFIVVYSHNVMESLSNIVEIVADINTLKQNPAILLLSNKCDLNSNYNDLPSLELNNCEHMGVSAKDNYQINEAISSLIYEIETAKRNF